MNAVLLVGSSAAAHDYIDTYQKKHSVRTSEVVRFDQGVKIDDVRSIRKLCGQISRMGSEYMVILSGVITLEAQNALLKLLEELPENITIFVVSGTEDLLLPTVVSRCRIVTLAKIKSTSDPFVVEKLEKIFFVDSSHNERLYNVFHLCEYVENNKEGVDVLFPCLQKFVQSSAFRSFLSKDHSFVRFSKMFAKTFPVIKKNNLNVKIAMETLLLRSI